MANTIEVLTCDTLCDVLKSSITFTCVDGKVTMLCNGQPISSFDVCSPAPLPVPTMTLQKTGKLNADKTITYTFTVKNTGTTTINGIKINDPVIGAVNLAVIPANLAPGATGTATAAYTPTAAQIAAGKVDNQATATGTDENGTAASAQSSAIAGGTPGITTVPIPANPVPTMTLQKTGVLNADGTITYTFTVVNTGTTTINAIKISDSVIGVSNLAITPANLAPGATGTATANYTPTAAQVTAGKVDNQATATGTDENGTAASAQSSAIAGGTPGITTVPIPAVVPVCTSTGVIPGTSIGGYSAGPCSNLPTLADLKTCLESNGFAVTLTPGTPTLSSYAPASVGNLSSVAGTPQLTASATATAPAHGNVAIQYELLPPNAAGTDITGITGGNNIGITYDNRDTSVTAQYTLTNQGPNPISLDLTFDPRKAGTTVETNIDFFTLVYDATMFDAIIDDPNNQAVGLATGDIVVSGTRYEHTTPTNSSISIHLQPKPGVYLAPGANTVIEWTSEYATAHRLENQQLAINIASLLTDTAIEIVGSSIVPTVTDGDGVSTALSGNCA